MVHAVTTHMNKWEGGSTLNRKMRFSMDIDGGPQRKGQAGLKA
jgi:hypothetical protein